MKTAGLTLRYELVRPGAKPPFRGHDDELLASADAGADVSAAEITGIECDVDGIPKSMVVRTGVVAAVPAGYSIELVPRSSLSKKGWFISNTIGIIDNGYRGELIVMLSRLTNMGVIREPRRVTVAGVDGEPIVITSMEEAASLSPEMVEIGERIAQMIIRKDYIPDTVVEVPGLSDEPTGRGKKGFGKGTGKFSK